MSTIITDKHKRWVIVTQYGLDPKKDSFGEAQRKARIFILEAVEMYEGEIKNEIDQGSRDHD